MTRPVSEVVYESVSAAFEGGYDAELKAFTNEELARDLQEFDPELEDTDISEILAAVVKLRGDNYVPVK